MKLEAILSSLKSKFLTTQNDILTKIKTLSADTIGWIAILCLHSVTLPSMIALMLGVTDNVPPVDMVIILWAALGLFFLKSIIKKDILNLVTIGLGFMGLS